MRRLRADNSRLESARRKAEAASQRKSRHFASSSHEIRTPMNPIRGYTDLLSHDEQRAHHADYLATIRESVNSLLPLLNGVLDWSKAETGHIRLDQQEIDLNELFAEMFRLFAPQCFAKGVELVVEPVADTHAAIHADPMRLKQVLVNLLSNAIRFTETGYIRLSTTARAAKDQRSAVRFRVEDCGCGIPEQLKPRLFEAFEQDPDSANGPSMDAGAGLGLSIASELIGVMGSRIEFDSTSGRSSTFWFDLELELDRATSITPTSPRAPATSSPRIALIDPDETTRGPYTALLERAGIEVEPLAGEPSGPTDRSAWTRYDAIVVYIPASAGVTTPIPEPPIRLERTGAPLVALVYDQGATLRRALWKAGYRRLLGKSAEPALLREGFDQAFGTEPEPPAGVEAPMPQSQRLLIVDDHAVNLRLMSEYAVSNGFEAITAASSEEALRCAGAEPYDAIVMDLHLPDRGGPETARLLRAAGEPNARTPIIAVTGDALAEQANRAIRAGIDDVLIKPVSHSALAKCLQAWVTPNPSPPPSKPLAAVDTAEAAHRARGRPDVARELFTILCRSLPQSRSKLARARAERDWATVREEAHRLNGAVAYGGVPRLEAALADLQRATRGSDSRLLEQAVIRVEQSIGEVLECAEQAGVEDQLPDDDACGSSGRDSPRESI